MFCYLKVGRIHPELEGMQLTEGAQTTGQVIDAFDGFRYASHDDRTMFPHLWGLRSQILPPMGKVGLRLRVGNQHPEEHRQE